MREGGVHNTGASRGRDSDVPSPPIPSGHGEDSRLNASRTLGARMALPWSIAAFAAHCENGFDLRSHAKWVGLVVRDPSFRGSTNASVVAHVNEPRAVYGAMSSTIHRGFAAPIWIERPRY